MTSCLTCFYSVPMHVMRKYNAKPQRICIFFWLVLSSKTYKSWTFVKRREFFFFHSCDYNTFFFYILRMWWESKSNHTLREVKSERKYFEKFKISYNLNIYRFSRIPAQKCIKTQYAWRLNEVSMWRLSYWPEPYANK